MSVVSWRLKVVYMSLLLFVNWFILGYLGFAANDLFQFSLTIIDVLIVLYIILRPSSNPTVDFYTRYLITLIIGLVPAAVFIGHIVLNFLSLLNLWSVEGEGFGAPFLVLIHWGIISLVIYIILLTCFILKARDVKLKNLLLLNLMLFGIALTIGYLLPILLYQLFKIHLYD